MPGWKRLSKELLDPDHVSCHGFVMLKLKKYTAQRLEEQVRAERKAVNLSHPWLRFETKIYKLPPVKRSLNSDHVLPNGVQSFENPSFRFASTSYVSSFEVRNSEGCEWC